MFMLEERRLWGELGALPGAWEKEREGFLQEFYRQWDTGFPGQWEWV